MDPLDDDPEREQARRAMGATLRLARQFDLAGMVPTGDACLAGRSGKIVYRRRAWGRKPPIVLAIRS
jgi:hypothetical protein